MRLFSKGVFTRPADTTAYASGDLIANSTTAGSVVAVSLPNACPSLAGLAQIRRVHVKKSNASVTNAAVRVHLFNAAPTVANGDNGVISMTGMAGYIGQVDVTIGQTFTDGAQGSASCDFVFAAAAGSNTLYALVEARGAYTPASAEVFTVCIEIAD